MEIQKEKIHHQYIAPKTEPVNASTFLEWDRCDYRSDDKSWVEHHIETTHRELQCLYCNFKVIYINSMNTHIQSAHEFIQTTASANSLSRPPAANLPVFVPGTTYSRKEYTVFFLNWCSINTTITKFLKIFDT